MSENLDLVRSIYAEWERGNFRSTDWIASAIEYVAADGAEIGTAGPAVLTWGLRDFLEAWEDFRIEADSFLELDGGRVLVLDRRRGRAKASGLDLTSMRTEGARVFHVLDGKVTKLVTYLDRERALIDLGLASS